MGLIRKFKTTIVNDFHRESPRLIFNILIAFLGTFLIAHLYSLFVPLYVFVKGYHIHHFYYGMLILAISAIAGILTANDRVRHTLSYAIGIGIGLIADELGLLLSCTSDTITGCSYLFPSTIDIVVIISLILIIFFFFGSKPIRWFLPRSWRANSALNASIEKEIKKMLK